MITVCTITGVLRDPAGVAMPNAGFEVSQAGIYASEDGAALPAVITGQANGSGEVSFGLLPGRYRLRWAPGPNARPYTSPLSVPREERADLRDLLVDRDIPQRDPVGPAEAARDAAEAARNLAQAWAEGVDPPGDPDTKSARSWALLAASDAGDALGSAQNAASSENNASTSEGNAATSEQNASDSAQLAADWAEGEGDPAPGSSSAKTWAGVAASDAEDAEQARDAAFLARDDAQEAQGLAEAAVARADAVPSLVADHGHLSALLGQTAREAGRLRDAQGVTPPVPAAVGALAAIVSQLARQVDGGRIRLAGGSLDDPAIQIGPASVYSATADTLSIAVAGVERLRITTSGITVFGAVTEVSS